MQAIVLRVDSPGGSGTASDVIWREVVLARKAKPVVVSMGDVAASGGYYIAMAGDAIVAQPSTITGSIGVFGGKFTLRASTTRSGITKEILTRGRNADLFSEYRPWDDEERAKFRGLMVSFYEEFIKKAAEGRKKTYEDVDAVAQGRVWTGTEALAPRARGQARRPRRRGGPGQGAGEDRPGPGSEPGGRPRAQGPAGDDPRAAGGGSGGVHDAPARPPRGSSAGRAPWATASSPPACPSTCRSARALPSRRS